MAAGEGSDQIWVAAGTYYPGTNESASYLLLNQTSLYAGFLGTNHPNLPEGETLLTQRNPEVIASVPQEQEPMVRSGIDEVLESVVYEPPRPE